MLADALPASTMLLRMIKPLLWFKYRLETAIIIYEMWGSNIKVIIDITHLSLCV